MNSPHKGQWRGASMFYSICAWTNDGVNNREAGDLRRHCTHYDVTIMLLQCLAEHYVVLMRRQSEIWWGYFFLANCVLYQSSATNHLSWMLVVGVYIIFNPVCRFPAKWLNNGVYMHLAGESVNSSTALIHWGRDKFAVITSFNDIFKWIFFLWIICFSPHRYFIEFSSISQTDYRPALDKAMAWRSEGDMP